MKKLTVFPFAVIILFFCISCDSTLPLADPNADPIVVIFRSEYSNQIDSSYYFVYCDNIELAMIQKDDYFGLRVKPGEHFFKAGNSRAKKFTFEPGKIYHLRITNRSFYSCSQRDFTTFDRQPIQYFHVLNIKVDQVHHYGDWSNVFIPVITLSSLKKDR